MQQFLLFCTMLIIASKAFSQELHGRQISRSINRRTSRFAQNLIPSNRARHMFRRLNFPMSPAPPACDSPDYAQPLLVPVGRCCFQRTKPRRNCSSRKNKRLTNRKRSRRKYVNRRWSDLATPFVFNLPEGLDIVSPEGSNPRWNFTNSLRDEHDSHFSIRNPNQYIVYLYPVFISPRKRRVEPFKKRTFLNLKKQYMANMRIKNKRSANNATNNVDENEDEKKDGENTDLDDDSLSKSSLELPPVALDPSKSAENLESGGAASDKLEKGGGSGKNLYTHPDSNFKYSGFHKYPDFNLYNPYLSVTQSPLVLPSVTFKYPYDLSLYESPSLRSAVDFPLFKETGEENVKRQADGNSQHDIGKLKEMLQEVQAMLGEGCEEDADVGNDDKSNKKKKKEDAMEESVKLNETLSMKEKIDLVAIPILAQISERLGKMHNSTKSVNATIDPAKRKSKLANFRCSADGTWKSTIFGTEMTFTMMPNMMLQVKIVSDNKSVINKQWSMQGLSLSRQSGPIMLAAIYPLKKKMASFIGQCKSCQNEDFIFGSWTMFTCGRKFIDLWNALETKMDVLKKLKDPNKSEPKNSLKKRKKKRLLKFYSRKE